MYAALHTRQPDPPTERLIACAQSFSPLVERTAAPTVAFEVGGLGRMYGSAQGIAHAIANKAREAGCDASLALAANPDAAITAARGFSGVHVLPEGDEAKYLETLPVALLSPDPDMAETLASWGIRRLRDLAALPPIGLAERLGPEGVRLRLLARGEYERPLRPVDAAADYSEEMELDHPVALLEPLSFILSRLLHDLCARLDAATELRLRLTLETRAEHVRALRLPVPMREPRAFLKLLLLDLEGHPPPAPVVKVWLAATPSQARVVQHGLFLPIAPEPAKLELTLARIAGFVGQDHAGIPEVLDSHRPDAFALVVGRALSPGRPMPPRPPQLALRRYRPAKLAQVQTAASRPASVSAPGVRGRVLDSAGPWRTSGDWWTLDSWARDEWDLELSDGGLYRVYCELSTGRWCVEGCYD